MDKINKPLCVLVIEDEWLVRSFIAEHLRHAGYSVIEATTGEEGLAFVNGVEKQIDLLFTDIQLGGQLSGWDVADAFRNIRPGVPVLYASGQPRSECRCVS